MPDEETKGPEEQEPQGDVEGDGEQPKSGGPKYSEADLQATLNRIVPERAEQARRSLLRDLGVESPEEIKQALADLKALKLEQMGEDERRQAELKDAKERAERAERERDQAKSDAQESLLQAAFLAEAGRRGAKHPEDAFKLAELTNVKIDGGKIEGVTEAVQALIDGGRLPLTGKQQAPPLDGGAGSGERPGSKVRLTPEQVDTAQKMGLSPEDYAKYVEV
jgi:multidrug efflux pump subunit AcrA (membrane-fusion protein)